MTQLALNKNRRIRFLFTDKRYYFFAFLLAALTCGLFVVPYALSPNGFFMGSDFVHQQVPYWNYAAGAIKSGNIAFADALDLGTPFVPGLCFA